jgi:hypothetical protein
MSKIIDTYVSDDKTKKAEIVLNRDETFSVSFYRDDVLVETRKYPENSIYYAEQVAENYVIGILDVL